jgi:putative transposase
MKKYGRPRSIVTDGLRAYSAAMNEIGVVAKRHEVGRRLNNRAENSHQPTRRRERIMKRFKSSRQVQRFFSSHDQIANVFSRRPNQDTAIKFLRGMRSLASPWPRNHARRPSSLNPSRPAIASGR